MKERQTSISSDLNGLWHKRKKRKKNLAPVQHSADVTDFYIFHLYSLSRSVLALLIKVCWLSDVNIRRDLKILKDPFEWRRFKIRAP